MSSAIKPRAILTAVALVALALVAGLGLGWFEQGTTQPEMRELEVSWQRVHELAGWVEPEPGALEPLRNLLDSWDAAGPGAEGTRLHELLGVLGERPDCTLDGGARFGLLLKVTDAATGSEGLEGADLLALVLLADRLRQGGDLLQFAAGAHLLGSALERCRLEPSLFGSLDGLKPPQLGELFRAVCRDALRSPALTEPLDAAGEEGDRGEAFIRDSTRQALADLVFQLEPRRDDPSSWSEVAPPAEPGLLLSWWSLQVLDRGIMAAKIAHLAWPSLDSIAGRWVDVVSEWNALAGAGEGR